jgi:hypothetical protein
MKKAIIIATVGIIAVGGLALATFNQWGSTSTKEASTNNEIADNEVNNQAIKNQSETQAIQEGGFLPYDIAFQINGQLYRTKIKTNGFSQPTVIANESDIELIDMEKYFTTSLMPKDVFEALPLSDNMIFYSGLQSNLAPNLWIYTERDNEGPNFNVRMFNTSTKRSKVLFGQKNNPNKDYAFKPFAIGNDNTVVYLEAFVFDSYLNNEEIWALDLNTLEVRELNVHSFYTITPAMSPDGKYLLYTAASQANDVHVTPNQLFVFDLEKNEESRIMSDEKAFVAMRGWIKSE